MIHYPFNFNSSLCHSNIPERIICITFGFHLMLFAKLVTPPYPTPPLPDSTSRVPARRSKQEQGGKLPGLSILIPWVTTLLVSSIICNQMGECQVLLGQTSQYFHRISSLTLDSPAQVKYAHVSKP